MMRAMKFELCIGSVNYDERKIVADLIEQNVR